MQQRRLSKVNRMNTTVTRLDQMLYAWLAEPNDSKFEQAFQKYYDAAFGTVVRYLARRAGGADLDLEQMAVDALLKFFCKAGRDRRLASEKIRDTLPGIEPLDGGPIHVRQVKRWTADVAAFHDTAMAFMVAQDGTAERDWKGEIHALAAAIPPLQQQGCHILNAVQSAVARILDPDADRAHQEDSKEPEDGRVPAGTAAGFAARLRLEVDHHSAVAAAVETKLPGTLRFVAGSWTVIESLPALRVPTNGYLFEIAHSVYLDECKARGRRKRGGSGIADLGHAADAADPDDVGSHPLARLELETEGFQSEESPGE
jgi:DNA-directed RNA polymerase specialized sigma24 family protein